MTDYATRCLQSFGLAVQLIPEAFNIIEAIGDDYIVARQDSLDGRIFFRAGILLCFGSVVDRSRYAQRLIVDEVDLETTGAGIGRCAGNPGLEVFLDLQRSCSFTRGGVACEMGGEQCTTTWTEDCADQI